MIITLAGCETTNNNAFDAAIAEMKAKDAEQDASVEAANKTAQNEAMTEQNRSALRALNDKIDKCLEQFLENKV